MGALSAPVWCSAATGGEERGAQVGYEGFCGEVQWL